MEWVIKEKKAFTVVGIEMRMTNQNGESMEKIPVFWQQFYSEHIVEKIPFVIDPDTVYAVYSDYDEQGYYSMLIGVEASAGQVLPPGLSSVTVPASKYAMMTAKGPISSAIARSWQHVWSHHFPHTRAFRADFERYDQRSKAMENAEVDLYVSIF
jgi:predicted transcriptional regulator YdeE